VGSKFIRADLTREKRPAGLFKKYGKRQPVENPLLDK
jgi:hypothetical protein